MPEVKTLCQTLALRHGANPAVLHNRSSTLKTLKLQDRSSSSIYYSGAVTE